MSVEWAYTLSEPMLGAPEHDAVAECLQSGWLSMGPRTREFESRFAARIGAEHAIAVSNGTAALHLALAAHGIGPEDEVVQPSINFVAAANMTRALGAQPVFADIVSINEPTLCPADLERRITDRTRAVVVMHYGGYAARMPAIAEICRSRDIPLIEDACHAPAQHDAATGRALGTIGAVGCFSFFSNKNMTTAEGGMVATDDPVLADRIRLLRSHGMTSLSWDRHHGRPSTYDVVAHGFNYRTDDLRAALGLAQLERLDTINETRRRLAACYAAEIDRRLANRAHFLYRERPTEGTAHVAGIVVDAAIRDAVRAGLAERGVQTSLHYPPIHLFSAFADPPHSGLVQSEAFSRSMITLPMHAGLDATAIADIVNRLAEVFESHG
ncbi:MAG: DegT/DnrJ/EryC1/StrS family aminotransferase [Pseudomonadota bacterium]